MTHRVMLVDDDPAVLDLYQALLEADPEFEVVAVAKDGLAALRAFVVCSPRPDLVVLDCHLPGLNGLGVAQVLRKCAPDVPILMVSGDPTARFRARAAGIRGFLTKGCSLMSLYDAVVSLIEGSAGEASRLLRRDPQLAHAGA